MVKKKQANINILVELDENKIPEKLTWSAPDGGVDKKNSKAIFLSIWDHKNKESLSIDLWTKEMPLEEMNEFFYQSLLTMGEAFHKATGNNKIKGALKKFSESIEKDLNIDKKHKKRS
tara:strand:+ start:594 stop:947 length:354 start_codon:yes stop_codon:yes gene_type:complete